MAYSQDIRLRVTQAVAGGMSRRGAAARFMVGVSTAIRWVERAASEGTATARRLRRASGQGRLSGELVFLVAMVEATPDMTMPELAERLLAERGVTAHPASLSRLLCRTGLSYKKTADGQRVRAPRRCRPAQAVDRAAPAADAPAARPPGLHR